jgi:hypothetical protein
MKNVFIFVAMLGMICFLSASALAADVTLTASDSMGTSSFNSAGHWSDGLAPSAGNDYFTSTFRLRTPADGGSYTFGGDSLTIDPTGGAPGDLLGLSYKGTSNTGSLTVDNLILNGGSINHINGTGDIFNLYGSISVIADSYMYAKQGPMNVYSDISGSGKITIPASDSIACELTFLSSANTYTGNIVNNGRLTLADDGVLNFVIGANGVSNTVSGACQHVIYNGDFNIDLSGAGTNIGDSWAIASATPHYFGDTFTVVGFTAINATEWDKVISPTLTYRFDESTGTLTAVVPEPSTIVLVLMGLVSLGIFWLRRK